VSKQAQKKRWPKYVLVANGKDLQYQRRVPTTIVEMTGCKPLYQRTLNLTVMATESQVHAALAAAHGAYEVHCTMLSNSSPDALTDSEIDIAATELLRKLKKRPQSLVFKAEKVDLASNILFGNKDDLWDLETLKEFSGLTLEETVKERAAEKLTQAAKYRPKTLMAVFKEYTTYKGYYDKTLSTQKRRNNQKVLKRIERFTKLVGDQFLSKEIEGQLQTGVRCYADERLDEGAVAPSSVNRELTDILSFLNWAAIEYSYTWHIRKPHLPKHTPKKRKPLAQPVQQHLVRYCLNNAIDKEKIAACIILIELQGGVMASEIERLDLSKAKLEGEYPYIVINAETKTNARKRIVPLVVGVSFIHDNIEMAQKWLRGTVESNHSACLKKYLRKVTGDAEVSAHWLRHSFRLNTQINEAPSDMAALIGGWSSSTAGISEHMLNYGNEGIETSEMVKRLVKVSRQIHKHLLE